MMYYDFTANGKQYKLRINIRNTVALEKKLGVNPIAIFGNGETIPTVNNMVDVLHFSLQQYQHNIGYNETLEIFEEWLNDGHTMLDFIPIILEIYKVSGIVGNEGNEKNV